ncbi:MAG: DsbA family protein [Chloroflexi bacterium]|jgi:protein-disulfide isomerase|nr:DsbA family protein [Chloroflexota bacterium]MBT3670545.1 DsbA family protein [Chloroflexota bacterium]MBT4304180.1 DsbA family protein [Chloroflexota bacterium]MBT4533461.1 DsbA family protein [Chloroflexota bacterium]MBT4683582.1 DsbA family protein [Chloroflexota bacterium]
MNEENNLSESPSPEEEEFFSFTLKKTTIFALFFPIFFLVGLLVGYLTWGNNPQPEIALVPTQAAAENEVIAQEPTRYEVTINDEDPSYGPDDAPVTIIEFSDYECPYCRRHFLETAGPLLEKYEGQIRLVFKDFPLTSIHPNAIPAAVAALCSKEQGEYWNFHDLLFEGSLGLSEGAYLGYAEFLELDSESFSECLSSERYVEKVNENLDYGVNLGVRSTPTFFVNGIPLVGAQPLDVFVEVIDSELAKSN